MSKLINKIKSKLNKDDSSSHQSAATGPSSSHSAPTGGMSSGSAATTGATSSTAPAAFTSGTSDVYFDLTVNDGKLLCVCLSVHAADEVCQRATCPSGLQTVRRRHTEMCCQLPCPLHRREGIRLSRLKFSSNHSWIHASRWRLHKSQCKFDAKCYQRLS